MLKRVQYTAECEISVFFYRTELLALTAEDLRIPIALGWEENSVGSGIEKDMI